MPTFSPTVTQIRSEPHNVRKHDCSAAVHSAVSPSHQWNL